jgi:hypothetical protein
MKEQKEDLVIHSFFRLSLLLAFAREIDHRSSLLFGLAIRMTEHVESLSLIVLFEVDDRLLFFVVFDQENVPYGKK